MVSVIFKLELEYIYERGGVVVLVYSDNTQLDGSKGRVTPVELSITQSMSGRTRCGMTIWEEL